ncbi:MAG: ATP-binding protein [Spirulina sp.]
MAANSTPQPADSVPSLGEESAIWVVLLSPVGVVQAVQTLGPEVLPPTLPQSWVGRLLSEVVCFAEEPALPQALATLAQQTAPLTLVGRFALGAHSIEVRWVLHPLFTPDQQRLGISAVGYWAIPSGWSRSHPNRYPQVATSTVLSQADQLCAQLQTYSPRLNQITRNVRWTLDLDIIQQQTVEGLGDLFAVSRCLVVPATVQPFQVVAECLNDHSLPRWQGQPLPPTEYPYLEQAAQFPGAVRFQSPDAPGQSTVAVATRNQGQINGFILLYDAAAREWTEVELALITDLADQVGTAMAHAHLFAESHALAIKLQQANASLLEKQREFQEARRQAEEARQQAEEASRLKSEFLANTSHELRTPLNGIIGFLKLVLDGMADDPEEQEEFIQEAHKSAIHLLDLINDVLDIAKIEAGKMQIDMVPVNLKELLAGVENFSRPLAEQKGLSFQILLPATRDEITINGNYQRLLQVLLNLVSNAVKFTHEGGITIQAEVKSQKAEYQGTTWPGTVKISVIDTGIGVSLEKQDRLFQSFSQVDGERTRQYGGTGLGLAISQRLVEAMGGTVHFISMGEGLGSTVTFTALLYQAPVLIDKDPVYPAS